MSLNKPFGKVEEHTSGHAIDKSKITEFSKCLVLNNAIQQMLMLQIQSITHTKHDCQIRSPQ